MELKELKKYVTSIESFSGKEVESIEPMTNAELDAVQYDLETEVGDNNSVWDYIRAFVTFRKKVAETHEENKRLREGLASKNIKRS